VLLWEHWFAKRIVEIAKAVVGEEERPC